MEKLQQKIDYKFKDIKLLERALQHTSYVNENKRNHSEIESNEKLEFLGDAVLSLVISHQLFLSFAKDEEGQLSKKRASLVNEQVLSEIALQLELDHDVLLGKGEKNSDCHKKPRILASTLEAILGAIYLDAGLEKATVVIQNLFTQKMKQISSEVDYREDFKTRLQEIVQNRWKTTPTYILKMADGPDHDKKFVVDVRLEERILATGEGRSKKQAEQSAAEKAIEVLHGS